MKNIIKTNTFLFALCGILYSLQANAATVYFDLASFIADTEIKQQVNLSDTINLSEGAEKTYWYSGFDSGTKTFSGALTDTTFGFLKDSSTILNISGGNNETVSGLKGRSIVIDGTNYINISEFISCKTATMTSSDLAFLKSATDANTITIQTLKGTSNSESLGFGGANTVLKIGTVVDCGYELGNEKIPLKHLEIDNLQINIANNNRASYFAAYDANDTDSTPSVIIKSLSTAFNRTSMSSCIVYGSSSFYSNGKNLNNFNAYVEYGKVSGTAGIGIGRSNADSTGSVTYIFTNAASAESTGSLIQFDSDTNKGLLTDTTMTTKGWKANYTMRAQSDGSYVDATQSFSGAFMVISGNVKLESGTLLINFGAHGNQNIVETIGTVSSDYTTRGSLIFNKLEGATSAKFGSNGDVGNSYCFNDVVVASNGGSLIVRLGMSAEDEPSFVYDALNVLTTATGSGTLVVELSAASGEYPEDFFQYMIVSGENKGVRVISWAEKASGNIVFTTTDEFKTWHNDADDTDYNFTAFNADDGLYVGYVAVPEPATYAALFGVFALGIAAWRKRR